MARKYGMEYYEVWYKNFINFIFIFYYFSSIGDTSIAPVFDYLFSTIIG